MNEQNSPRPATHKHSYLPENREKAIEKLNIKGRDKNGKAFDETPFFLLYLNYAVNNIVEITRIDSETFSPEAVEKAIWNSGKQETLANFLWLFHVDNPKDEFPSPDCLKRAVKIARKIYELRNFFTHLNECGNEALLLDHDLYVLLEGEIGSLARSECMEKAGARSDKLNKLKLVAPHNDEKSSWELTRKGLIFLTCLALYKDDAIEFCNLFRDMKLAPKPQSLAEKAASLRGADVPKAEDIDDLPNQVRAKAFHNFFTAFSTRKGRTLAIPADDFNFMCFGDIIGYLNKVPVVCQDYLSLDDEKKRLQDCYDESTESIENKLYKYSLHRRFRDRFLTFAVGYSEDFNLFPSLLFKRLDITPVSDRQRYLFGKDQDNRLHMDRHYSIVKDAIRFKWVPRKHYGPIHIGSLRSSISATQMKQLLVAAFQNADEKNIAPAANLLNREIDRYFTAYHLILEKMVNAEDCDALCLSPKSDAEFFDAFCTVTGKTHDELMDDNADLMEIAAPFFPANLTRFFLKTDNRMSVVEMQEALYNRLAVNYDHAVDFIARLDTLDNWRREPHDKDEKRPRPVCSPSQVLYPPRHCNFSDADYCAWFFRYINLFLSNDKKFRQLPKSRQHRGDLDYEYQFIQSLVGKFSLDQKDTLWTVLEKHRSELKECISLLKANIHKQVLQVELRMAEEDKTKADQAVDQAKLALNSAKEAFAIAAPEEKEKARIKVYAVEFSVKKAVAEAENAAKLVIRLQRNIEASESAENRTGSHDMAKGKKSPYKVVPSLPMLARAAADEYAKFCQIEKKKYDEADPDMDAGYLRTQCRRFGIRPGMEKDRDALLKTILRIDPVKWGNAFDYENREKRATPRQLSSVDHKVSQVPFPNLLPQRFAATVLKQMKYPLEADGSFDFNRNLRELKTKVELRDFYDFSPLVAYAHTHDRTEPGLADDAPGICRDCPAAVFTAANISRIVASIKDVRNQDAILCKIAFDYLERYKEMKGTITRLDGQTLKQQKKGPSIVWDFGISDEQKTVAQVFDVPVMIPIGGRNLKMVCNDLSHAILAKITNCFSIIARHMDDPDADTFEFYRMVDKFHEIQAADRQKRLEFIRLAQEFDAAAPIPASRYVKDNPEQNRAMEFAEYSRVFPALTADEYGTVREARNQVYHDGLDIDVEAALNILRKYLHR